MGGPRFLSQGLDGETDKISGTKSILFECKNCGHCRDFRKPDKDKDT